MENEEKSLGDSDHPTSNFTVMKLQNQDHVILSKVQTYCINIYNPIE